MSYKKGVIVNLQLSLTQFPDLGSNYSGYLHRDADGAKESVFHLEVTDPTKTPEEIVGIKA